LIIVSGFYEWQWLESKDKNKIKYEIGLENEELFAFGGIYSQCVDTFTGEIRNTYALVTTEANSLMAEIHNIKRECQ
jgi:putative SOS response-associated peptidase YedK